MKSETNKSLQARLQDAHDKNEKKITAQINGMAEIFTILKMEKQQDFNDKIGFVKDSQGLTSGPTAVSAGPAPQPGPVTSFSS